MPATTEHDQQLEERLTDLDQRLRLIEAAVRPVSLQARPNGRVEIPSVPPPPRRPAAPVTEGAEAGVPREPRARGASMSDLVGGRVLAWIGGVATLVGIALFLVLAVSRGWIGIDARVILAGVGSSCLMGAGVWLHARRGRTEASVVLVAVATAGLFATLVAASDIYGLIAPQLALLGSIVVGAIASALAVRWAGQAIAVLGLLGALIAPVWLGASVDSLTVAVLAVAAACATWTAVRQRWNWLASAVVLICAPQWGRFVLEGQQLAIELSVLSWFGGLGLVGALAMRSERPGERLTPAAAVLLTLSGLAVALVGAVALRRSVHGHGPELWLAALAILHLAAGLIRAQRIAIPIPIRRVAMVVGLILADVAFGLSFSGITLAIGWAAAAVALAAVSRRAFAGESDRRLLQLGVGAHVALTLVRALLMAPPASVGSGTPQLLPLLSVGLLAASCLACGQLANTHARVLSTALNALGLAAIAYLTALTLTGPALAAAWAMEGLALTQLDVRTTDRVARWGAAGFLGLAALHAMVSEAPPPALVTGAASLPAAATALGAIALALAWSARVRPPARKWFLAGTAGTLLYLASVAIITVFQPTAGGADATLLDLSVRQQGQVLLSTCWSLVGLGGLIFGLRRNLSWVRNMALGFLLVTVAKVFLYDLSTLTSLYRVVSFVALGLLLLAGAFAYQRLRPPPAPDFRSVHPSQR